jgi:hypothetical protein
MIKTSFDRVVGLEGRCRIIVFFILFAFCVDLDTLMYQIVFFLSHALIQVIT